MPAYARLEATAHARRDGGFPPSADPPATDGPRTPIMPAASRLDLWMAGLPVSNPALRNALGDMRRSPTSTCLRRYRAIDGDPPARQRVECAGVDEPTCAAQQPVRQAPGPDTKRRNSIRMHASRY